MEIYLIRHTTPDIQKGICYGQSDIGVKDSFKTEVGEILIKHPYLESLDAVIYSSPLKRCKQLAKKLFDTPIQFDNRLKELDFGDWELKPWDDIDTKEFTPWMEDFVNVNTKNGESYIDLQKRVFNFLEEIMTISTHQKIIIVTHSGVIRTVLSHFKNVSLKDSFEFKIDYGQVFKLPASTLKMNTK